MIYQKYIARCYRVYQHERNENASFLSIFNGGGRPKWRFSNFPRFWKNSSALGSFNCIFENNSLKALFGQNIKKLKILKLSPDSRYFQKLALKEHYKWEEKKELSTRSQDSTSFPGLSRPCHFLRGMSSGRVWKVFRSCNINNFLELKQC